jgi:hypothetical protein
MKVKELSFMLESILNIRLTLREKEYIWEAFKVKPYLEDNPDDLNMRLVSLQAFVNAKKQTRLNKINQLISLEADDE